KLLLVAVPSQRRAPGALGFNRTQHGWLLKPVIQKGNVDLAVHRFESRELTRYEGPIKRVRHNPKRPPPSEEPTVNEVPFPHSKQRFGRDFRTLLGFTEEGTSAIESHTKKRVVLQ